MRTYSGNDAGSQLEPLLAKARESVWISSPWLGSNYAEQLADLSQKGIEVRIITSNDDLNVGCLEILKTSENPNLMYLVLDKKRSEEKASFVHSKIYIIDKAYGIAGSANLTWRGLHSNVENLSIAETKEEVQQLERDFMVLWMTFERKSIPKEELSSRTSYSIRNALSLFKDFADFDQSNVEVKELAYHPYYFFEFSFRASVGRSPPVLFENRGFVVLDARRREIVKDDFLREEINNGARENYVLNTNNKYRLVIHPPVVREFQEAKELVLNHIIEENTQYYTQYYGSRSYDRIFVPYRNIISFIKSGFVQVPIWYVEICEPDGSRHQDIIFGSSGKKWTEFVYCADCQRKIWIEQAMSCEICGRKVCPNCIKKTGFLFKKKLCTSCFQDR
jgi:hypothetical protein